MLENQPMAVKLSEIGNLRLSSQQISRTSFKTPEQVLLWMGGIQGQDYAGAKWSIGLRLPHATEVDVESAFASGSLVRTWPMRGTLHVVAAADVHWLVGLTSAKNLAGSALRRKNLELDESTLSKARKVLIKGLQDGKQLSREEIYDLLERARISTAGQRGYHILWNSALNGVLCFARPGKTEQLFALLDDWVPRKTFLARDEALAELALRYFCSRGPATVEDFLWWSGLSAPEARSGFELIKSRLEENKIKDKTYWIAKTHNTEKNSPVAYALPGFDEFVLGYKDRSAVLDSAYAQNICPGGNGMFASTIVIEGRIVGTWKRTFKKVAGNSTVKIDEKPFTSLNKEHKQRFAAAAWRYAAFLDTPLEL